MSSTQIASLALKLCGFVVILIYLPIVPTLFLDAQDAFRVTYSLMLAAILLGALFVVVRSDVLARLVVRDGEPDARFSAEDLQPLALSVMGFYLLLLALEQWAGLTTAWLQARRTGADGSTIYTAMNAYLVLQTGAGIWLFFGGRRCANVVRRFQRLGIDPREAVPAGSPSEFQVVAFSVVGLVFLVSGIDALLRVPQGYLLELSYRLLPPELGGGDRTAWAAIAWILARILLGAAVFVGSRRLAAWWSRTTSPMPAV
jgi:hypothetical protein